MYENTNFKDLPFSGEFFVGLLEIKAQELLRKFILKTYYHYKQEYEILVEEIRKFLPQIINKGFLNFFFSIQDFPMNTMLKEEFGYIMETCKQFGVEQCYKIGEMMISIEYPHEVYTYFQNSDILAIEHLYIINYLLNKKHNGTVEFIKKYLRWFLTRLAENMDILMMKDNQQQQNNANLYSNFIIQVINSKYHSRIFSFLFICVQRNNSIKNKEPFTTFFKLLFNRYPPRMVDSIKRQLSVMCNEPIEDDVVYVNPTEYSKPTLRCKKCLECFTTTFDAIKHSKLCKKPTFDGIGIDSTRPFEENWDVVQNIFFNSKHVKDMFVSEEKSEDEMKLMVKWVSLCDLSKVVLAKKIVDNDIERSAVCTYHREYMKMPNDKFNIFENISQQERRSVYIKDVHFDENEDSDESDDPISVDEIPQFLQGNEVQKGSNTFEMYVGNDEYFDEMNNQEVDEMELLTPTNTRRIGELSQQQSQTHQLQSEQSIEIESVDVGDDTTDGNTQNTRGTTTGSEYSMEEVHSQQFH